MILVALAGRRVKREQDLYNVSPLDILTDIVVSAENFLYRRYVHYRLGRKGRP